MAIIVTPGAANANAYAKTTDFAKYNAVRYPTFVVADDAVEPLLIQATRVLDLSMAGTRTLIRINGEPSYYLISRRWSGAPTNPAVQALAWPRTGMYNRNGAALASTVIPSELVQAVCELAGQMATGNRFKDNSVVTGGIKAFTAGPVSFQFKDTIDLIKLIPDVVYQLLVPSWILDETTESVGGMPFFEVL